MIPAEGGGLKAGEVVCLTPLAYPANGAKVLPTIDGVTPDVETRGEIFGGKGGKGKGGKGGKSPKGANDSVGKSPRVAKPVETAKRL